MSLEYRGYRIAEADRLRITWEKNIISGHEWSVHHVTRVNNRFRVLGPGALNLNKRGIPLQEAKDYVDYLIKFGRNRPLYEIYPSSPRPPFNQFAARDGN